MGNQPGPKFATHPIDELFVAMASVEPYPAGVVRVPARIPGTAFFPGGAGLWGVNPNVALRDLPVGGVMVLGHDFHSEAGFLESLAQGTEVPTTLRNGYRTPATWINLRQLLTEAAVPLERCFFTNVYMGLRAGGATTGRFPGSRDAGFVERCRRFLLHQLSVQQPSSILTLGTWVPSFIAPLAPALSPWNAARTMDAIDEAGPVIRAVEFPDGATKDCTVIALTHPSLRGPNVRRRRFGRSTGHEAELAMLRELKP